MATLPPFPGALPTLIAELLAALKQVLVAFLQEFCLKLGNFIRKLLNLASVHVLIARIPLM